KKIISNAKAQAETNQNNTAMIFIENFDNFASNPLYGVSSIYEQKAFSQLLAEMESSRKNDKTNLLVMGSMNMPDLLDENIMKPYKFLNSIVVYQPRDSEQRKEVLEYYIDKMNLQIDGESIEDVEKAIKNISETTYGFSVVDLMYLLETAQAVSMENGRDKINSSDFTEAFLQTISGRANTAYVDDSEKKIVSSHEAGHALNLQIMCEIAKKSNIPWHLPDNVDFITLDPRGDFGGAMFHKSNKENRQTNFETVMSNIICSYGGHSAEKIIYNMPGSWGITADMENVSYSARRAVMDMGMGPETGVYHVIRNAYGQADVSERKKMTIEKDIDSFTQAGNQISDMIVENYKDFILEFTEKYYSKVATGECLIPGEQFVQELNDWRNKQTPQKQAELLQLETSIEYILDNVKKGNNKK
ncbi:MAG: AAA family ATPase, partial [Candidatus Gastranaerophilales bacterium]|nr:AAA family ATPase [Candidatus Gastranaerophilales bacterium]